MTEGRCLLTRDATWNCLRSRSDNKPYETNQGQLQCSGGFDGEVSHSRQFKLKTYPLPLWFRHEYCFNKNRAKWRSACFDQIAITCSNCFYFLLLSVSDPTVEESRLSCVNYVALAHWGLQARLHEQLFWRCCCRYQPVGGLERDGATAPPRISSSTYGFARAPGIFLLLQDITAKLLLLASQLGLGLGLGFLVGVW